MSDAGSDPRDRPDGSFYNPFPGNSPPGLIGGQFASQQANSPGAMDWANLGASANLSGDGAGLPPPLTLPQLSDPSSSFSLTYQPGVDPPSDAVGNMLSCMAQYYGSQITVTSTSEPSAAHPLPSDPHNQKLAADVKGDDPEKLMQAGANCGAVYQQNEYTHPSPNSTGAHVHLQLRPGRNGAAGPYYPLPNLTPWTGR